MGNDLLQSAFCIYFQCTVMNSFESFPLDNGSAADYGPAKQAALRLLAYRPRAVKELRQRLKERFSEAAVEKTLADLQQHGLLDDTAFAQEWRRQRELRRPRGAAAIGEELRRLGVDSDVIREALADYDSAHNAYRAAHRYAARLRGVEFPEFKRKLWAFLQRRGFESSVARQTVERLREELFDPDNGHVDRNREKQ